ncbi:hypothetical protein ACROYT_G037625 [Oculina patagonica]
MSKGIERLTVHFIFNADFRDSLVLKFVIQPTDVTVAKQSNVTIACVAVSSSTVTYKWTHNGTQLKLTSRSGRYRLNERDGNLTVINTTLNDAGEYRCIASDRFGSALSLKAEIRIAYLKGRSPVNNTITAAMYSSIQFPISAVTSFPKARFAWRVRKLGSSELDEKIVDGENDGRLLISQSGDLYIVGVRSEDTGTYTCVVSNPFVDNDISVEFVLTVLEGVVDRQLSFLLPPIGIEATVGTAQVMFECIVAAAVIGGSPQMPSITWHKNDTELDPDHDPKYSFPNGGISRHKLIINHVGFNDADGYSCIATTTSDVITSPSAQLTVNPRPVVPSFKPGFPSVISPFIGTDVAIDCHVSFGSCNWYKNAVKILFSSSPRLSVAANGSLLVHNLSEADSGLYQVFAKTNVNEISSPSVRLVVEQPPLQLTTLAPSVSTESVSTKEPSSIPTIYVPAQQSTTGTHVTTRKSQRHTATLLHRKKTTAGFVVSFGTEKTGKTAPLLIYGAVGGGVLLLLLVILGAFFYKTRSRRRSRQGSMKLKSDPDPEQFEMKPVQPRNSSPARTISVRRLRSSDSRQDLLEILKPDEHRMPLDANENQFTMSHDFQDHMLAHVNPALTREPAFVNTPRQQTTGIFQDEIRVLIEDEPDDLIYDSGIEEEVSDSLQRSPAHSGFAKPSQAVNKTKNRNISCQDDNKNTGGKYLDKTNDKDVTKAQEVEPLYHVLEGPGGDCSDTTQRETGNKRSKTSSFYQSLMPNYQSVADEKNLARNTVNDHMHGLPERLISSSTGLYQSLIPPKHDNVLNDEPNVSSEAGVDEEARKEEEATEASKGIYQPLLHRNHSHLLSHSDRPRSITGIYQPLSTSSESSVPFVRCWSAPQGSRPQNPPEPLTSANGQDDSEPVYQAVADDEQRCPLNLDDPSSSFPRTGTSSPWASPVAQRRTIHEPTYVAVHVRPSRQNRRACHSEHEPRYSPSPCRKSPSNLQLPASFSPRGHRRNFSDGGRALSAIVNPSGTGSSSPPVGPRPPSALPRHLGHRRNRSDIGLCPIDRSREHLSRRLTSTSDGGIPRTPSLGSLVTENPRSASDTTHWRVHIGP